MFTYISSCSDQLIGWGSHSDCSKIQRILTLIYSLFNIINIAPVYNDVWPSNWLTALLFFFFLFLISKQIQTSLEDVGPHL